MKKSEIQEMMKKNSTGDNRQLLMQISQSLNSDTKLYKIGFWLFFLLAIFSVTFSVWAISSVYSNFQAVTKILDESFDRTNIVMDITSGKIASCNQQLSACRAGQEPTPPG
jgi:hypothetical protein